MPLESAYQAKLIRNIRSMFPDCIILKNDTDYLQGIPDLLVLWQDKWAILEVKPKADAKKEPNQEYYVNLCSEMSFGAFIYPENEEEVLDALQQTFGVRG